MKVQDLIHLLQTRCKPDHEVNFNMFINIKDKGVIELTSDTLESNFDTVYVDEESNETVITVTDDFIKQIAGYLYQKHISLDDLLCPHYKDFLDREKEKEKEKPKKKTAKKKK